MAKEPTQIDLLPEQQKEAVASLPAVSTEADSVMAIISRVAADPGVDVARLEKLTDLYERISANKAKAAFDTALSDMQPKMPVIERMGKITIKKRDSEEVIQSTPYALFEDINEAVRPLLAEHGFALSFRTGLAQDGKIAVTGILSHRGGHREETTITLPHDSTGSKNAVQAVGSSTSYGKRYVMTALLNITTKGCDDDGLAAGAGPIIDDTQADVLRDLIESVGADRAKFLKHFKIESVEQLPAKKFSTATTMLKKFGQQAPETKK